MAQMTRVGASMYSSAKRGAQTPLAAAHRWSDAEAAVGERRHTMHKSHFAREVLRIPCHDEVREGNHSEHVGGDCSDAASEAYREWTGASEAVHL